MILLFLLLLPLPLAASASNSSTGTPALSSTTLSDPPSSTSSPIVRSPPPPPLHPAPLTSTNTGRSYVPPPAKVKRPRTSPGSISNFAPAASTRTSVGNTGGTPRTSKSSMSKTSRGGGMPISCLWASRPVYLRHVMMSAGSLSFFVPPSFV